MILLEMKIPQLSMPEATAVRNKNSIGDRMENKTLGETTALLIKLRVKLMDWPSMSPDLNPFEHLWGILKWKVEECKVHHLCDVVMEEWKSPPCQKHSSLLKTHKL